MLQHFVMHFVFVTQRGDMHEFPLTLQCAAIGIHLWLAPTMLIAHHTVSLFLHLWRKLACVLCQTLLVQLA